MFYVSVLKLMPQNNMPVFFEALFLEAKKTGKLFFNRDSG